MMTPPSNEAYWRAATNQRIYGLATRAQHDTRIRRKGELLDLGAALGQMQHEGADDELIALLQKYSPDDPLIAECPGK